MAATAEFLEPSIRKNRLRVLEEGIELIGTAQHIWDVSIRINAEATNLLREPYRILQSVYENLGLHMEMLEKRKTQNQPYTR